MRDVAVPALVAIFALTACPARAAADEPSDGELVAGGLAMALPTYMIGVVAHEGSHALAAELVGGDTTDLHLWPGRNPYNGAFQFGWTRVVGLEGRAERLFFYMAPKITDLVMLGSYGALYALDGLPDNAWGHLTLQVLATGFWVDFSKDVLLWKPTNDVVRFYNLLGLDTELERLPARIVYAAAAFGWAYVLWLGYRDLFASNDEPETSNAADLAAAFPILTGSF